MAGLCVARLHSSQDRDFEWFAALVLLPLCVAGSVRLAFR
jgi:hypothetical protein